MLSVQRLAKHYGDHLAVDDLSFEVARGEILGFLGPNGAGKTTTLRMIAGFLAPTRGKVLVDGLDVESHAEEAKRRIGYMPEAVPLYPEMRVREYLRFRAELKGIARAERTRRVGEAMDRAFVDDVAEIPIGKLSKGYRQRVGLADALVASPPLLVLDEPTAGLDPNQIREVRSLVASLAEAHTIVLSTHILSEVEAVCSRALVLARGRVVAQGTLDEIRSQRRPTGFEVRGTGARDAAKRVLGEAKGPVRRLTIDGTGERFRAHAVFAKGSDDAARVEAVERAVAELVTHGLAVHEARLVGSSLEEVFALVTDDPSSAEKPGGER